MTFRVEPHEVVALLGRNGAGKSTTLKSLIGLVRPHSGSVVFDGEEIAGKPAHAIAQAGMQLVPEDRRIFGALDVEENLKLASFSAPKAWTLERIFDMFPASRRTSPQSRHRSVGRRAADVGDRACAHSQSKAHFVG